MRAVDLDDVEAGVDRYSIKRSDIAACELRKLWTESTSKVIGSRQMSWKIHAFVKQPQHVNGLVATHSENHQVSALAA